MTTRLSSAIEPRSLLRGLGLLFCAAVLGACARKGVSYPQLINLVASNECPQARLTDTRMLVAFVTAGATRYVHYPSGEDAVLDSTTLFQLGTLTTAYLVPKLASDLDRLGLTLDSVAMTAGELVGQPWELTFGDLLLHHTGLPVFEAAPDADVIAQVEDKLTRIGRTPPPQERDFQFDHWNYTLVRMALAKRLPDTRGDLRSDGLDYVDRADTTVRLRLAPSEAAPRGDARPRQATELFVASTGAMASAEQLVRLVQEAKGLPLEGLTAKPTTRPGTEITLGWYRSALSNGHHVYTNAGRTRHHGAAVAFYPHTQTGVVVLAADSKPVDCLALDLLRNVNDNWKREPDAGTERGTASTPAQP